jgi:hypothetical protein
MGDSKGKPAGRADRSAVVRKDEWIRPANTAKLAREQDALTRVWETVMMATT